MVFIERYRAETADILTSVGKTAATSVCNLITTHRTFVAGDIDYFYNVRIFIVSAHSKLHAFSEYGSFFIYAAAHCGSVAGNYGFGYIQHMVKQGVVPCKSCNFTENFVF